MTVMTDLNAVSLSATAKAAAAAKGVDLSSAVNLAKLHVLDLKASLAAITAVHPSTGGDTTSYNALVAVIAELA
jgi:hypothetical protein